MFAGSSAYFVCAANGTSVEIQWEYNGDNYTGAASVSEGSEIHSTRNILELKSPSSSGSVTCIIRQSFDGTIGLNNDDFNNSLPNQNRRSTVELIVTTSTNTTMSETTAATGMYYPWY